MQTDTPPSRRRTLFAAASAVIMGSGISAGVAASVADIVETSPDAQLIAIGAEARKLGSDYHRLLAKWWRLGTEDSSELESLSAAMDGPHNRMCELSDRAAAMQASTPEGWQAKAALIRHALIVECETDGQMVFASSDQELTWSLICDLTGSA